MSEELHYIKAKAEMLSDEQIIIALLKKVMQEESAIIKYNDVLREFEVIPSKGDFTITVNNCDYTIAFRATDCHNLFICKTIYQRKNDNSIFFFMIRDIYAHRYLQTLYKKYCE